MRRARRKAGQDQDPDACEHPMKQRWNGGNQYGRYAFCRACGKRPGVQPPPWHPAAEGSGEAPGRGVELRGGRPRS
eukprot:693838-Alexandrium_andersonii.AAC.1